MDVPLERPSFLQDLTSQLTQKASNFCTSAKSSPLVARGFEEVQETLKHIRVPQWKEVTERADATINVIGPMSKVKSAITSRLIWPGKADDGYETADETVVSSHPSETSEDVFIEEARILAEEADANTIVSRLRARIELCINAYKTAFPRGFPSESVSAYLAETYNCAVFLIDFHLKGPGFCSRVSGLALSFATSQFAHHTLSEIEFRIPALKPLLIALWNLFRRLRNFFSPPKHATQASNSFPVPLGHLPPTILQTDTRPMPFEQSWPIRTPRLEPSHNLETAPLRIEPLLSSPVSPQTDYDDIDSLDRSALNPLASEFVPSPTSKQIVKASVAGLRTHGLSPEDSAVCLEIVELLKEMLEQRSGTPLKQPGLSRKLYPMDLRYKPVIDKAGGLRSFIKRFNEFRTFPGKNTVWFVALRELDGQKMTKNENSN